MDAQTIVIVVVALAITAVWLWLMLRKGSMTHRSETDFAQTDLHDGDPPTQVDRRDDVSGA